MGTTFELLLDGEAGSDVAGDAFREARGEVERLESLLSRFDEGSELSRLNQDRSASVGPELFEVVSLALEARERTGGRFDPTVHGALVHAGYDRPYDELKSDAPSARDERPPCGGAVRLDAVAARVELAPGVRLDLGGIAKGWAADRALGILTAHGPALVNAGGDIAAWGQSWPVGVESAGLTLAIEDCGLATSGSDRRRWRREGEVLHHLIDPATSRPAETDLLTATVVAPTAAEAEALATWLFLAGSTDRAATEADDAGIAAVLVARDGRTVLTAGLV